MKVVMSKSTLQPLPYDLRIRAERLSGQDLSDITFEVNHKPYQLGTLGYTNGDHICLSPGAFNLPHNKLIEILGHELTHIMQHRAGRLRGELRTGKEDVDYYGSIMEHEAHESGKAFANGSSYAFGKITPKFRNSAPIQTYVLLAGKLLSSVNELSDSATTLLGFIKHGNDWFDWALKQQNHGYSFLNEPQLVEGVQYGLHGNNLISISPCELIVNPAKLLKLSTSDINLLARETSPEQDNKVVDLSVSKMLAANGLRVKSDLVVGTEFLDQVGVADAAIFQMMSLNDLISLFNMVNDATTSSSLDTSIQKEAAQFALGNAQSALEFIDLYEFYISLADKLGSQSGTPEKRSVLAEQYLEDIMTVLYDANLSLIVEQNISVKELRSLIQNWVDGGQNIGFNNLSRGASQVMKGTSIGKPGRSQIVSDVTKKYLSDVQNFIKSNEAASVILSQDGLVNTYTISTKTGTAALDINQQGYLTLAKYQSA